eukprot:scaffold535_cov260-Pinguiococcus_pyrenoidosus.AAC.41
MVCPPRIRSTSQSCCSPRGGENPSPGRAGTAEEPPRPPSAPTSFFSGERRVNERRPVGGIGVKSRRAHLCPVTFHAMRVDGIWMMETSQGARKERRSDPMSAV